MEDLVGSAHLRGFSGSRVFITGTTGFKGGWLAYWLSELGAKVVGFALPADQDQSFFHAVKLERRIRQVHGDLRNGEELAQAVGAAEPDFVFHLAAEALVRRCYADPAKAFAVNCQGTVNLLNAVREKARPRAIVAITSDKCYLNKEWAWGYRETDELGGKDPYSASKAAAEMAIAAFRAAYFSSDASPGLASARAGNVIGGGDWSQDRIVPDMVRALAAGREVVLRQPKATRPWQHVLDPINGYLLIAARLAEQPRAFAQAWNFGPAEAPAKSVAELASAIGKAWGPHRIALAPPDPNAPHEATLLQLSIDKARHHLAWEPRLSFAKASAMTAVWYLAQHQGAKMDDLTSQQIASFQACAS